MKWLEIWISSIHNDNLPIAGSQEHDQRQVRKFECPDAGQGEQDQAGVSGQVGEVAVGGEEVEDGTERAREAAQESVPVSTADGQTQNRSPGS